MACAHCAAIFPKPIFKSIRTKSTILTSSGLEIYLMSCYSSKVTISYMAFYRSFVSSITISTNDGSNYIAKSSSLSDEFNSFFSVLYSGIESFSLFYYVDFSVYYCLKFFYYSLPSSIKNNNENEFDLKNLLKIYNSVFISIFSNY